MKTLYYYYYLFYTKILTDDEPHATVIFTLSFSESLVINGIIDIVLVKFFCVDVELWIQILILVIIIFLNYFNYSYLKKSEAIVNEKPKYFGSHLFSILVTMIFFVSSSSLMFWGPIYTKSIFNECR